MITNMMISLNKSYCVLHSLLYSLPLEDSSILTKIFATVVGFIDASTAILQITSKVVLITFLLLNIFKID